MPVPVIMPKLEMTQETATLVEWLVGEGEAIQKGAPLLTVETDKVTVDIESPASGVLAGVQYAPPSVVPVTEVIAYILAPGEELPDEADSAQTPAPRRVAIRTVAEAVTGDATPVARRLAASCGIDLAVVGGTGPAGRVTKTDVERAIAAAPAPVATLGRLRATPAARRIARERGVDLASVSGSGPRGRVQKDDVLQHTPPEKHAGLRVAQVVRLEGVRRTIAERMAASSQTAPHIYLTVRVDMQALEERRAEFNAQARAGGQAHVSVTAMLVQATAISLSRHAWINSMLRDDEILLLGEVNVGVAVALEHGLIVPVVRHADQADIYTIAAQVNDLAKRARDGRLKLSDVAGGTFTLSNLGPFGIEQFTGIINPPQTALLAVGATQQEVVVGEGGGLFVRPIMRMTLSADHRVVDGARAAAFLQDLRERIETWGRPPRPDRPA